MCIPDDILGENGVLYGAVLLLGHLARGFQLSRLRDAHPPNYSLQFLHTSANSQRLFLGGGVIITQPRRLKGSHLAVLITGELGGGPASPDHFTSFTLYKSTAGMPYLDRLDEPMRQR